MKPTGLAIVLCVGASTVMALLLVWPAYEEMLAVRHEAKKRQLEYEASEAYSRKLREIKDRLDSRATELERLEAAIPKEPGLPALYGLLQTIASESGLVLKSVNSSPVSKNEEDAGGAKRMVVDLKLAGSYASLKTFIQRAHAAPRFLNAEEIAFLSSRSSMIPFDISLLLSAYSY